MLPSFETKIVATIGPASGSEEVLADLVTAGMNVARLNFSHGDFESHRRVVERIRRVSRDLGIPVGILADLPGPRIRVGEIEPESVELVAGAPFVLTTEETVGDGSRASVAFASLPEVVSPGDAIYLNDGFVELVVEEVAAPEVRCRVRAGGELRSRKGVNLPGIDLGIGAFTARDRECLAFALEAGVDIVSQSFVASAADIAAVRAAAAECGHDDIFVVAKIERAAARERLDEILDVADGIMVARGDLGVEIPIEQIAVAQKLLIRMANAAGKPVITATHMLESMTGSRRPTRAEATDVANAVLDGTDAVMLSGESAVGRYPAESVRMLARIAAAIEPRESSLPSAEPAGVPSSARDARDVIALAVDRALEAVDDAIVVVPTVSGATARSVARCRPEPWILAVSPNEATVRRLQLTRGVWPVLVERAPDDWRAFVMEKLAELGREEKVVILTEGPSPANPDRSHRMEILEMGEAG
ncbi:MAG: pyruvate kinase [Planctomycetota bacterium]